MGTGLDKFKEHAAIVIRKFAKDKIIKKKMRIDKIPDKLRAALKNITNENSKKKSNLTIYKLQTFYEKFKPFFSKFILGQQKNTAKPEQRVNV
ncbi:MAG: hypothetical protein ISQ13_03225 [Candidatus Margulisbacteria bacterium]|nr:hypothetical protein [Candidatus Margulisiibacteriota bacterium]